MQNINFGQLGESIAVGMLLSEVLLSQNSSRMLTLQIKKHVKHFEAACQYLISSTTLEAQLKVGQVAFIHELKLIIIVYSIANSRHESQPTSKASVR